MELASMTSALIASSYWRLDPSLTFLNHGSFGACPIEILDAQSKVRDEMERSPVRFNLLRLPALCPALKPLNFINLKCKNIGNDCFVRHSRVSYLHLQVDFWFHVRALAVSQPTGRSHHSCWNFQVIFPAITNRVANHVLSSPGNKRTHLRTRKSQYCHVGPSVASWIITTNTD